MEILMDKAEYQLYYEGEIFILKYIIENITKEVAENIILDKLKILESKMVLAIIDARLVKNFDNDARKLLGSKSGIEGVSKCAILTNSKTQAVMVNFYMKINKPTVETKMFQDPDKAINWLKQN